MYQKNNNNKNSEIIRNQTGYTKIYEDIQQKHKKKKKHTKGGTIQHRYSTDNKNRIKGSRTTPDNSHSHTLTQTAETKQGQGRKQWTKSHNKMRSKNTIMKTDE